jgi:hypothetical protein
VELAAGRLEFGRITMDGTFDLKLRLGSRHSSIVRSFKRERRDANTNGVGGYYHARISCNPGPLGGNFKFKHQPTARLGGPSFPERQYVERNYESFDQGLRLRSGEH